MPSMYNLEKMVDAILLQVKVLCDIAGIEPMPLPTDDNYDPQAAQAKLEELTDPDA